MGSKDAKYCGCLYYSANALSRTISRIAEEEFRITGLAPSHAFLLMSVNDQPGINPTEISGIMQLSPSTVTRLIEKMEAKGYLERRTAGRHTEVFPTEKSRALNMKIHEAWVNLYKRYSALLGEAEAAELAAKVYQASSKLSS